MIVWSEIEIVESLFHDIEVVDLVLVVCLVGAATNLAEESIPLCKRRGFVDKFL